MEMTKLTEDMFIFYDEDNDDADEPSTSATVKSLKLDVKTRWHSQLVMIESFTCQNKNVINVMLQR